MYSGQTGLEDEFVRMMGEAKCVNETAGYGLECSYIDNLGYGHSRAIRGHLSTMTYDPECNLTVGIFNNVLNWGDMASQRMFFREADTSKREILGY